MAGINLSQETTYATKGNIKFPGTQAQATGQETLAQSKANSHFQQFNALVALTVSAGAIQVSN